MPDHLRPKSKGRQGRSNLPRTFRKNFLIVCEGDQTEPNYFRGWKAKKEIEVVGTGYNTLSLVRKAISVRDRFARKKLAFDQIWVVFDRDDHKAQDFNAAIALASKSNISVAYSNEAFELWYVWHLNPLRAAWHRSQLLDYLKRNLEGGYRKEDTDLYERLQSRQGNALQHAKTMASEWGENHQPLHDNPSSSVYLLVEALNANSAGSR